MPIYVCPYCLHVVGHFSKDYMEGEVKSVNVDLENKNCQVLLSSKIYRGANCSKLNVLKSHAGRIAKEVGLCEEQKKRFLECVVELKRQHPRWKDYKILEVALNSVLEGG